MKTVEQVTSQPFDVITAENAQEFVTVGGQLAEITSNTEVAVAKCLKQLKPYITEKDGKKYIPFTVWATFRERLLNGYNAVAPWGNDDEKRSVQKGTISPFVGKVKNVLGIEDPKSENIKSEQKDANRKTNDALIAKLMSENTLEELKKKADTERTNANKFEIDSTERTKANKKVSNLETAYRKKKKGLATEAKENVKPIQATITEQKKDMLNVDRLVGCLSVLNPKMVQGLHFIENFEWVERSKKYPEYQKKMQAWLEQMPSFAEDIMQTKQK